MLTHGSLSPYGLEKFFRPTQRPTLEFAPPVFHNVNGQTLSITSSHPIHSMDCFKGISLQETPNYLMGKPMENLWFPVDFSLNQSMESCFPCSHDLRILWQCQARRTWRPCCAAPTCCWRFPKHRVAAGAPSFGQPWEMSDLELKGNQLED